jgi:hypothetical protein
VARKKDAKALFEVMAEAKRKGLGMPGWFARQKPAAAPGEAAPGSPDQAATPASSATPPGQAAQAGAEAAAQPPSPYTWSGPGEPLVSLADGRVRISLNKVSAIVAVAALAVIVAGAFFVGRRVGRSSSGNVAAALDEKPAPLPVEGQRLLPNENDPPPQEAPRKKGMWYLVIQDGILDLPKAKDIQAFLKDNQVDSTIVRRQTNKWMVLGLKDFESRESPEAEAYQARIGKLGLEYGRKTKQFNFRGCYFEKEK